MVHMNVQKQITLSSDPDLFFSTDAASQISKKANYTEHQAQQFEKALRAAIFANEIGNYDYQTGELIEPPLSQTAPLTVRLADVYDWIARSSYKEQLRSVIPQVSTSIKVTAGVAVSANRKTAETLDFEAAVHAAMTAVWNDWQFNKVNHKSLPQPTKNNMYPSALNKLLEKRIKGKRKQPNLSMVRDAARSWNIPASIKLPISPALAPPKRHSFKGEK